MNNWTWKYHFNRNSLSCTVCENLLSEPYTPEVKYLWLGQHLFIHVYRCAVLDPTFQLKGRFSHMGASLSFSSFENTCSCRRPHVNTFWRIPKQCTCRRPRVNTMFARVARVVWKSWDLPAVGEYLNSYFSAKKTLQTTWLFCKGARTIQSTPRTFN